jgi:hypothetical protein
MSVQGYRAFHGMPATDSSRVTRVTRWPEPGTASGVMGYAVPLTLAAAAASVALLMAAW